MTKHQITGKIKDKGWAINEFLAYIGRSYPWYHNNINGDDKQRLRLMMLVDGLLNKQDVVQNP